MFLEGLRNVYFATSVKKAHEIFYSAVENCSLRFLDSVFPAESTSSFPELVHFRHPWR
jgi:hypothetical protein